ncbi:hypothetical protein C8F04DRAFT_1391492 [Mycena alexandri]|uniref:DUF6697 domain-containing protein n=1 Tax=Mycena alexandri TaxID=1745969 RepID=A0AAD6X8Y7_9AGAR|nr:hypothetical protein C8F04DRAFT_1391492 [Mycena alexandri]
MDQRLLSKPDESKVKVEHQPRSTAKTETKNEEFPSNPETAMLKDMLSRKTEEALQQEVKFRIEIAKLENENRRLKMKRTADGTKIEALTAELARLKETVVKNEKPQRVSPKGEHGRQKTILEPETRAPSLSPILVLESDAEQQPETRATRLSPVSPLTPTPTPPPMDVQSAPLAASGNPSIDSPGPPRTSDHVSRDTWASPGESSTSQSDGTVVVKDEIIDVVIKVEGEADHFTRVMLIKSEDGNFDIWNVDGFNLGPTIKVDDKFKRGFTRKVISDAFGGGHMTCYHHWKKPKPGQTSKTPFLTFNRSWNNALPVSPGLHGIGFFGMSHSPVKPNPLNFFVGEGTNNWRLLGTYNYLRCGEIAPHHISLLPGLVLNNWINGMLSSQWGKSWIEDTNAALQAARRIKFTHDGILKALQDGRLRIPFTILQCVGYPEDWFKQLLYYEKHPKPAKSKRKRRGPTTADSPKKQARTLRKGKGKMKEEPVSDSSEELNVSDMQDEYESDNDDSEYSEGPRRIAPLPTRTSPRKSKPSESPEL